MGLRAPRLSALQEKLWSSLRTEEYVCGDPVSRDVKKKKKLEDTATHSRNPRHRYKMHEELGKLVSTALSEHMERLPSQD